MQKWDNKRKKRKTSDEKYIKILFFLKSKKMSNKISTKYAAADAIDAKKMNMFRSFVENEAHKVKELYIHANVDTHDPNDFARGFTAVLGKDAKLTADVLHRDMHSQVMLFKILETDDLEKIEKIDENDEEIRERLNYAIQQDVNKDIAASLSARVDEKNSLYDSRKWISTLGSEGRVGLYRIEKTEDSFDYYLLVQTGATSTSNELYRWLYEMDSISVSELLKSDEYRYARSVAQRNAQRLAAKAAEALGLKIETIADHWAKADSQKNELQPQMGLPCAHNEFNLLLPGKYGEDEENVFYLYDGTCSTNESKGALLLLQDPRSSVFLFPAVELVAKENSSSNKVGRSLMKNVHRAFQTDVLSMHEGVTHNRAGDSFPLSLGNLCTVQQAYDMRSNLTPAQRRLINKRIVWEKKQDTKWFNHRVVDKTVRRFDTNNARLNHLMQALYDRDLSSVEQLKPVLLKISANNYDGFDI